MDRDCNLPQRRQVTCFLAQKPGANAVRLDIHVAVQTEYLKLHSLFGTSKTGKSSLVRSDVLAVDDYEHAGQQT